MFDTSPPSPPPPSTTENQSLTIIPGLPNDVASLILSMVPFSHHARIKQTCKSWKHVLSSKSFFSTLRRRNHLICFFHQDPSFASPFLFDPHNLAWCALPPMPCNPQVYGLCNFAAVPLGHHLYILGGSLFDTRSFPIDRPFPSSATFRLSLRDFSWRPLAPMLSPRGSFACAVKGGEILVAGGGSRHTTFAAARSSISSAERYDVKRDRWYPVEGLPGFRAGCVGFVAGGGGEFWVMGGYEALRTISGVFPVDEYYRDAVVMGLEEGGGGGKWREVGDMWGGDRVRTGKIVVVEDDDNGGGGGGGGGDGDGSRYPWVYMLDGNEILRFDMASNRWLFESCVPRKAFYNSLFGFVAVGRELYVLSHLFVVDLAEIRRSRHHHKSAATLYIQIYNPEKKAWRSLVTKLPFNYPIDINCCVLSSICL